MFKKLLVASALLVSANVVNADTVTVGGVTWDPNWVNGNDTERDFIAKTDFTQWFSTSQDAAGTLGSFNTAIRIGDVLGAVDASDTDSGASGYFLSGGGEINRINDPNNDFCPSCELTFAFGGIGLDLDGSFNVGQDAWLQVYVSDVNYDNSFDSFADVAALTDGDTWLSGYFASAELTLNSSLANGTLTSIAVLTGGLAADRFDPMQLAIAGNGIFGDVFGGVNADAKYTSGANGQVFGNTVPNPSSIALFGLAIVGVALAKRRKA